MYINKKGVTLMKDYNYDMVVKPKENKNDRSVVALIVSLIFTFLSLILNLIDVIPIFISRRAATYSFDDVLSAMFFTAWLFLFITVLRELILKLRKLKQEKEDTL